ncbi:Autophagy-related protein [Trema orientale]|uniref:Autophagy-related protein n=1 Tax=Trema orientale TaxID=63057 RepID=A0A2P5EDF7_TREOI|nr:Autophagy-related protein [Trema orientale]
MASSHGNAHSESAKMEQIITEFFAKSLQIILESRSPYMSSRNYSGEQGISSPSSSSSSSSSVRPRDKWFNLALKECPAALENIDLWRQSNPEPMVVDVILVQKTIVDCDPVNFSPKKELVRNLSMKDRYPICMNSDQEEFGCGEKSEEIVERWVVQYESRKTRDNSHGNRRSSNSTLYKKTILLLRSLYATVRLLPAYKIYHDLNSSSQIRPFTLGHRVSSFVEPFTRREEAEMQRFVFTPVDTSCGRLCLSVLYRSSVSDISSEPSTPLSPQVIPDYVGSPLADPLKRFPSIPVAGSASHGSPSSSPFTRRHSWSFDIYRNSTPLASFSPSPTHSEPQASNSNPSSRRFPPSSLPPHPPETSLIHKKDTGFDEYFPSPVFSPSLSPSASPSPPICIPVSHLSNALLRYESAPVRIPTGKLANSPVFKQTLPPSPSLKNSRSSTSMSDKSMGAMHSGTPNEKLFPFWKEETRQFSGVKLSSNSSPRVSLSRSSSPSFPEDFDEPDFACPFDVDEDDITDPSSRPKSFEQKGPFCEPLEPGGSFPTRKSQNAAVGALVLMLKKAPPLRQDFSKSVNSSEALRPETWGNYVLENNQTSEGQAPVQHVASSSVMSSGLVVSKTTADALEELQGYRELKNLLLSQGSKSHI